MRRPRPKGNSSKAKVVKETKVKTVSKVVKKSVKDQQQRPKFEINSLISSFLVIPPSFYTNSTDDIQNPKNELNLSGCPISSFEGIERQNEVTNLDISGTYIDSFKGACALPKLKSINIANTPLSLTPFADISCFIAFGKELSVVDGVVLDDKLKTRIINHQLYKEIQERIRDGYFLLQLPTDDTNDIDEVCFKCDGFVSKGRSDDLIKFEKRFESGEIKNNGKRHEGKKRTASEVITILNNFSIRPFRHISRMKTEVAKISEEESKNNEQKEAEAKKAAEEAEKKAAEERIRKELEESIRKEMEEKIREETEAKLKAEFEEKMKQELEAKKAETNEIEKFNKKELEEKDAIIKQLESSLEAQGEENRKINEKCKKFTEKFNSLALSYKTREDTPKSDLTKL